MYCEWLKWDISLYFKVADAFQYGGCVGVLGGHLGRDLSSGERGTREFVHFLSCLGNLVIQRLKRRVFSGVCVLLSHVHGT